MNNIFDANVVEAYLDRLQTLKPDTQPKWGKMNAPQVLAHLNVAYEMIFEPEKHPAPKGLRKLMLKWLVKSMVTSPKPYKEGMPTAPSFIITDSRDFEREKNRLTGFMHQVQQLGAAHFEGKESHSFGKMSSGQWNTMLAKHLDHHFNQFGI